MRECEDDARLWMEDQKGITIQGVGGKRRVLCAVVSTCGADDDDGEEGSLKRQRRRVGRPREITEAD